MKLVKILLAIFIPPIAAFLQVGVGAHFWLNILLTIIGFFPGMVHALWLGQQTNNFSRFSKRLK